MLSEQTCEPLDEAQGLIRTAIRSAAVNEKPLVVHQLSKLLTDIEHIKTFDGIMDIMESQTNN